MTTAQLAWGQTSVITVKIGDHRVKICPADESSCVSCNLILCVELNKVKGKKNSLPWEKIVISMLPTGNITY